ncbi:hypothetical protein XaC1_111 [Xanthomonas phage XaC1]|nr:hypothetical protein XaC1_111 [Xanthomonas phage XaC1]
MRVQYEIVKAIQKFIDTKGTNWKENCVSPIILGIDLSIVYSKSYYIIKKESNFVGMHIPSDEENLIYLDRDMCLTWDEEKVTHGDVNENNVQVYHKPLTRDDYFNLQLIVQNFDITFEEFIDMISYNHEFLRIDVEENN